MNTSLERPGTPASARGAVRVILPLVILLFGVGAFAALKATKSQPQPLESREKAWSVVVQPVKFSGNSPNLRLFGRTESPRTAHLTAGIAADVIEVLVLEGQRVSRSQELIRLDDREAALSVTQYEAEIRDIEAQKQLELQKHANDLKALAHEKRDK